MVWKFIFLSFFPVMANAQELFSFTEPASNMPAKSIGIRMNNLVLKEYDGTNTYNLNPEVMWGASKNIMIHADIFMSNRVRNLTSANRSFGYDGAGIYFKYRFYSKDDVHNHFRLAAYSKLSFSNAHIHQPAIDLNGDNTGSESGIIATKLINKIAVSASSSFIYAMDNGSKKFNYGNRSRSAIGYTLSVGKLMLPKEYTDYKQINLNLMLEFLGQYNTGMRTGYLDVATSIQFIFLSKMRLDIGYSFPVSNKLFRTAQKGALVRLEYNLFNVYN
ncbi:MAG: hypothetical protein WKF35_07870 [Ferruginibacter sp.]